MLQRSVSDEKQGIKILRCGLGGKLLRYFEDESLNCADCKSGEIMVKVNTNHTDHSPLSHVRSSALRDAQHVHP